MDEAEEEEEEEVCSGDPAGDLSSFQITRHSFISLSQCTFFSSSCHMHFK
jgi:hypothetical protein